MYYLRKHMVVHSCVLEFQKLQSKIAVVDGLEIGSR